MTTETTKGIETIGAPMLHFAEGKIPANTPKEAVPKAVLEAIGFDKKQVFAQIRKDKNIHDPTIAAMWANTPFYIATGSGQYLTAAAVNAVQLLRQNDQGLNTVDGGKAFRVENGHVSLDDHFPEAVVCKGMSVVGTRGKTKSLFPNMTAAHAFATQPSFDYRRDIQLRNIFDDALRAPLEESIKVVEFQLGPIGGVLLSSILAPYAREAFTSLDANAESPFVVVVTYLGAE